MNKNRVFNVGVVTMLITAAILGMGYVAVISGAVFSLMPNPPKPEIRYGEFPFRLIYELNGETKIIEDTVICEFDGFKNLGSAGKYRKWKTYLESGNERLTLLDIHASEETNELGYTILEFFFSYGNGEYYMGDEWHKSKGEILNYVEYLYKTEDGKVGGSAYSSAEAWEKYKIRLISWEPSSPIVNAFK